MILCCTRVFKAARMFSTLVGHSGREYVRQKLILRMTNLDPAKRALMSDIIMDPYWN
ncbi:uncharacterized protein LY89DRAFT_687322 [Mollisia scopiformis]|uniref:Uncharacterized protein n=1 Tax=Mollisia scopiformis TaxID=149040 RepID=A0A194X1H6_MOLSC|nr:uncharacterized protein LY89DRAFT_687322 [Mollisia scopiformis]KUJ14050.1 hypothetical protein LY89DRAFT_687322 [Mollisia scopiformis]